ncbi:PRC-barrel domain-containing protein [Membranicola marinus]|uniref:PRC-barrel domain-containing protein n=2 Tax=Membranihabitans marinus TaxID=1227546 RepID=A0A953HPY7_9BACT|nr:PRC-barrel domain-containing protein [Membranihabitans marinus]
MLSATSINGTDVKNHQNESLGDVKDLMINTSTGEVEYAVLSFGGFLGIGDKYFAVPFKSFQIDRANKQFMLDVDREFLENSPGFDKDNWPGTADNYFSEVTSYYDANYEGEYRY